MQKAKRTRKAKAGCREVNGFELVRGVERPKRSRAAIYPWKTMEVGEAFFLAERTRTQTSGLYNGAKRAGVRISCFEGEKSGKRGLWVERTT